MTTNLLYPTMDTMLGSKTNTPNPLFASHRDATLKDFLSREIAKMSIFF